MVIKKRILMSIGLAAVGKAMITTPVHAFPDSIGTDLFSAPPSLSAPSGTVNSSSPSSSEGTSSSEGISTSSITIPPGMNIPGTTSAGTTAGGSGSSGSGISGTTAGGNSITGDSTVSSSGTTSGDSGGETASGGSNNTSGTVSINDIANYFVSSINQSLEQSDTSTTELAEGPRRIVRRRSTNCLNPQASEDLDDLLAQSQDFISQVKEIQPENSIW